LDDDLSSRYSQFIGVLQWAVKLGRIDIYYEVSVLLQHLAFSRVVHLEAVYHIFAYLMKHNKLRIVYDPADPIVDDLQFPEVDWTELYGDMVEELPPRMPEPLGNPLNISAYVDANHAGNAVTRRLHSGILIIYRTHQSFGKVVDRILSRRQLSGANLWRYGQRGILLLRYVTS
jgi:hypothetical protein